MEQRFGHDFSQVRVHSGGAAEQSARDVNANAYTVGHNIVFGAGQFAPETHEGRRLLAHELTHVAQQEAGIEPRVQRQPAPDVNKSAKFIEETYRTGARQLQDPALSEAASNVRLCREQGGYYCEILLTDDDINSMYAEWTLIEDVFNRETANKAIVDHNLREVASRAAAEVKKRQAATGQYAVAAGGLVALKPLPVSMPIPPTSAPLPYITPLATPANANVALLETGTGAAAETGTAAATGASTAAAALPVAVVVFGIIVAVQLWNLGQFQQKLWRAGYKFLPSPRGVCMRGCHQGTRNLPRTFDFPEPNFPPLPRSRLEPFGPRSGPLSPGKQEDIEKELKPFPQPEPEQPKRRRKCKRAPGSICPVWQPRLTQQHDYWNHAYDYRRRHRMLARSHFNQNVAVLVLEGGKVIAQKNDMGFHSEQLILWTLAEMGIDSDCPILGLFSERKPCQEICQKDVLPSLCRINNGVPFNVYFATDTTTHRKGKDPRIIAMK